jgi:hypothetical protein
MAYSKASGKLKGRQVKANNSWMCAMCGSQETAQKRRSPLGARCMLQEAQASESGHCSCPDTEHLYAGDRSSWCNVCYCRHARRNRQDPNNMDGPVTDGIAKRAAALPLREGSKRAAANACSALLKGIATEDRGFDTYTHEHDAMTGIQQIESSTDKLSINSPGCDHHRPSPMEAFMQQAGLHDTDLLELDTPGPWKTLRCLDHLSSDLQICDERHSSPAKNSSSEADELVQAAQLLMMMRQSCH